jgi:transcriptional regulator with XRE-family HTH domain
MSLQSRDDLIANLRSKKYRDAFVSSRVSNTLALQIRAMRQERGWSQAYLAKLLGTSQNAVYRLESPQYGKPSITTLKRLASIFDVGLAVWFTPFSKLVDRVTQLSTDDILVPSFDDDPGFQQNAPEVLGHDLFTKGRVVSPLYLKPNTTFAASPYQRADNLSKLPALGEQFELRLPEPTHTLMQRDTREIYPINI